MSSGTDWSGTSSGRTTRTEPGTGVLRRASGVPPRPPQSRAQFHGARVAIGIALAVLTYLLFPGTPAERVPVYDVGAVAASNVIAPFAFAVPKPPAELARERAELARAAEPIFVYSSADLDTSRIELQRFAAAINAAAGGRLPCAAPLEVPASTTTAATIATRRHQRVMSLLPPKPSGAARSPARRR